MLNPIDAHPKCSLTIELDLINTRPTLGGKPLATFVSYLVADTRLFFYRWLAAIVAGCKQARGVATTYGH